MAEWLRRVFSAEISWIMDSFSIQIFPLKLPLALFVSEPRTCSVRPCALPSSCSTWCRHRWSPTTSSCPTPRGTRRTPRAVSAPTPWAAAPSPAWNTPRRGCPGTAPKLTRTRIRIRIRILTLTLNRLKATHLWITQQSLLPSLQQDTPTRLRGRLRRRQLGDLPKKWGGGSTSSSRKVKWNGNRFHFPERRCSGGTRGLRTLYIQGFDFQRVKMLLFSLFIMAVTAVPFVVKINRSSERLLSFSHFFLKTI